MRTGGDKAKWWGINNKTNIAGKIVNKAIEMLDLYSENIDTLWFWLQLKTFVEKNLSGQQVTRQTRYQAADTRIDFDDAIFGKTFAYICSESYSKYEPTQIGGNEEFTEKKGVTRRFVQDERTNWQRRLCDVSASGRIIRYVGKEPQRV